MFDEPDKILIFLCVFQEGEMVVQMSITWDFLPVFIQLISQLKCSARQVLLCYYDMIRKGRIMHLFSTFKNQPYVKHRKPYVLPRTGSQPFWREGFTFLTAIICLRRNCVVSIDLTCSSNNPVESGLIVCYFSS